MGSEIRRGQLIAPFGPGSLYIDKYGVPTVICGVDFWFKMVQDDVMTENREARQAFIIKEPRLEELLKIGEFREPPVYTSNTQQEGLRRIKVQGHRFPRWYVDSNTQRLVRFNLETRRLPNGGIWRPVRFMAVCANGHLSDFPWKQWSGCECTTDSGLHLIDSGGSDLGSIRVECRTCGKSSNLRGALKAQTDNRASGLADKGIICPGERPWLGEGAEEHNCSEQLTGVLINQSNVYFAKSVSSIFIPPVSLDNTISELCELFSHSPLDMQVAEVNIQLGSSQNFYSTLRALIESNDLSATDKQIDDAYEVYKTKKPAGPENPTCETDTELLAFRRVEYNTLRKEVPTEVSSELRVVVTEVDASLKKYLSRVNLVERLRETRVFCGFDRLRRKPIEFESMPDVALHQIFRVAPIKSNDKWLPAVKSYGEGIFLELNENSINEWLDKNSDALQKRYDDSFTSRMAGEDMLLPPIKNTDWRWVARFQLIHTLSHLLINQMVFDCGYSSASLKERLFVSNDDSHPMSGILIYTASGDSEGSLGGLVNLGRPEMFKDVLLKALTKALWCSADPVCSENISKGSRLVNKAACHACTLLPETACETINNGLDRAAVVGLPTNNEVGFFCEIF